MKIQDIDTSKESVQVQELTDNIRSLLNNGEMEFEVVFTASPAVPAPNTPKIVLSIFGATYRLYISYLANWYYVGLTKL